MQAKAALEGKDIFQNCCHVAVSYSSLPELRITTPGPKARDFLAEATGGPGAVTPPSQQLINQQQQQQQQQQATMVTPAAAQAAFAQQMQAQAAMAGQMGFVDAYGNPVMNPYMQAAAAAAQQQGQLAQQQNPYAHMAGQFAFGGQGAGSFTQGVSGIQNQQQQQQQGGSSGGVPGSVLLVSNLPVNSLITPDSLFMLFGAYGDVIRVKILFKQRDTAMIQFKDVASCRSAITNLNQAPLGGPGQKPLNVSVSKNNEIRMPKANADGTNDEAALALTADFTQSRIHRYKNKPIPEKNIHPPSQVLHVANLPDNITSEQVQQLFGHSHFYHTVFHALSHCSLTNGYLSHIPLLPPFDTLSCSPSLLCSFLISFAPLIMLQQSNIISIFSHYFHYPSTITTIPIMIIDVSIPISIPIEFTAPSYDYRLPFDAIPSLLSAPAA
jgi:polypyrimidine tract-binding protein 1